MDEMLTAADEARLIGVDRSSVSRARKDKTHPVHSVTEDPIRLGGREYYRAPKAAVAEWWKKRWAGLSADDLARKRRRPVPDQGAKA
jgi:hypothetical protein